MRKQGIKSPAPKQIRWTPEMRDFIKNNRKKTTCLKELAVMASSHFGLAFTVSHLSNSLRDSGIRHRPLYSERIDKKDGYTWIKISITSPKRKAWKEKHRWLWEQANGPIPEGMVIIFLDRDRRNCELENLALISRAENVKLIQLGLISNDREATLTGIAIVRHLLSSENHRLCR
jgi:hypothetical protein